MIFDKELKEAVEDVVLNQNQGESGQEATEKLLAVAEKYRGQKWYAKSRKKIWNGVMSLLKNVLNMHW